MREAQQLAALETLHDLLDRAGIPYWLFGGWGVDFHVGEVTRPHDDLDVAVWAEDRERAAALLVAEGWAARPDEHGYTTYTREGVTLELAYVTRDDPAWPVGSFGDEVATLQGVRARVVGRASLVADKSVTRSDANVAAKDRADVERLLAPRGGSRSAPL